MRRTLVATFTGLGTALALAAGPALADNPVDTQYGNPATAISQQQPPVVTQQPPAQPSTSPVTTSPVTTSPVTSQSNPPNTVTPAANTVKPATTQSAPPQRAVAAAGDETLPVTGLDLGVALAVGLFATVAGFALRRAGRSSSS